MRLEMATLSVRKVSKPIVWLVAAFDQGHPENQNFCKHYISVNRSFPGCSDHDGRRGRCTDGIDLLEIVSRNWVCGKFYPASRVATLEGRIVLKKILREPCEIWCFASLEQNCVRQLALEPKCEIRAGRVFCGRIGWNTSRHAYLLLRDFSRDSTTNNEFYSNCSDFPATPSLDVGSWESLTLSGLLYNPIPIFPLHVFTNSLSTVNFLMSKGQLLHSIYTLQSDSSDCLCPNISEVLQLTC